jgi:hypothetical protein
MENRTPVKPQPLLLPKQQDYWQQPQQVVGINHRWFGKFVSLFNFSNSTARDLIRNYATPYETNTSLVTTNKGMAIRLSGAASIGTPIATNGLSDIVAPNVSFSGICVFRIASLGVRRVIFGDWDSGGSNESVFLEQTSTNQYRFGIRGSNGSFDVSHGAVTIGWHVAIFSHTINGGPTLSIDGAASSVGAPLSGSRFNGIRLRVGSAGNLTSLPFNGDVQLLGFAQYVISTDEIKSLSKNPWQIFKSNNIRARLK